MALPEGFNWFLILAAVVVSVLVLVGCVYLIVEYQHPEDRNQAWVPKFIVLMSLWLAICSVLLFPLDVANQRACSTSISPSSCHFTLPMKQIWFGVFIANLVLVFAILPFTLFFYEADSDFSWFQKMKASVIWTLLFMVFIGLVIGILYALVGYVEYPTQELTSGLGEVSLLNDVNATLTSCIKPLFNKSVDINTIPDLQCSAFGKFKSSTWKLRVSLPVYVMAVQSVLGWLLFLVFAGVGVLAAPIDWLQQFLGRPTKVITKSEYITRARIIAQRAKVIQTAAQNMRRGDKDRRWRSNFTKLQREVVLLEDDEQALEKVFPQGEDGDVRWVLFILSFWLLGVVSLIGFCISGAWIAHIIVYMLPPVPLHPLLNEMFVKLDGAFSLLGVSFFAGFCLYLMAIAMKGNFMLGLNFLIIKLYPMRPGATMMSSFIVNTALVLTMAPAILQFCAQAFAVYANNTAIFDVFGNQVQYLMYIKYIYNFNIFLYIMLGIIFLSGIFLAIRGKQVWKKRDPFEAYSKIDS